MPVAPNKDLGPCSVTWDPTPGVNVELNPTFGGVKFHYEELRAPIKTDQSGETDIDEVTIGAICTLEVPMTQSSIAQLLKAFANASSGANYLKVSNPVGAAVFADAKEIVVKPIVNGVVSVTATEWLHLHRTYPKVNLDWAYDNAGQRTTAVIFKAFPDESPKAGEIWRLGPAA